MIFFQRPETRDQRPETRERLILSPGAVLLGGFAKAEAQALLHAVEAITQQAPFRHYRVAGGGRMAAAMTACGDYGWISDGQGYRYVRIDPLTRKPWPALPSLFLALAGRAAQAAGYEEFRPAMRAYQPLCTRCRDGAASGS